jgi:hypothetical protein
MFSIAEIAFKLPFLQLGATPISVGGEVLTPEQASIVFSGPKFLVALLAGIVMAFAFQLLLTNLSLAVGISSWGSDSDDDDDESESLGSSIRKVEAKVGIWALITSSIAIFAACFLAVKLSLIESTLLGAIIGVVIWSTYFSLIVWFGSSAVGSLIGAVSSTATSGFQQLMGTATTAMGANAAKKQMVSTAEDITAAVRRELTSGIDPDSIKNTLQSSLSSLQLPKLDVQEIRTQFNQLLSKSDLQSVADSVFLENINRQTFVDLLANTPGISKQDINLIADELEAAWQQNLTKKNPTEQVINLLKSASPEDLQSEKIGEKIQQLVAVGSNGGRSNGVINQAVQYGLKATFPAVVDKVDVSSIDVNKIKAQLQKIKENVKEVDVDKITNQLQELTSKATQEISKQASQITDKAPSLPTNTIKADVDSYLLNSFPWHFNRITVKEEFKEVIYDPNANPRSVKKQLEELNEEYFVNRLKQRGDISEARIKEIAQQLESDRREVLETVQEAEARETKEGLRSKIENYLRSSGKEELNPEAIESSIKTLLEDSEAGFDDLTSRLSEFDRNTISQLLKERGDINEEEVNNISSQLERTRDSIINQATELQEQAKAKASELRQRVEDYLRNTNKEELNPEGIKRDFQVLLDDPQAGIYVLRQRLSQFDRDTLVKLLSQRQDLNEEEINQTIDQLEVVRNNILQAPQKLAGKAKEQYEQTLTQISEYLRSTNLEELDPEGIQRDLTKLLENPQEGASALQNRLSHVDRETLVKLLTQQGNLSEEEVNQTIDKVQQAIGNIVKAPQRFANRVTKQAQDFEKNLEAYLRNTNKEELNPEGIKRDLQLLLQDPRGGIGNLSERASKVDRSTIVALLTQREDITEEEANRIVGQIESVRDSVVEQFRQVQQKVQSVINGTSEQIRNYLNSLNRPELNFESIQQDFSKLFDDPQLGFEALRDRLSQFDRDTLVAVLTSREDISEEQANQIIARAEAARDSVLHRAERIQQETKKRLKAVREKAKQQAVETQKTVAGAAWWLFSTALVSLVAAVVAGAIAVQDITFLQ